MAYEPREMPVIEDVEGLRKYVQEELASLTRELQEFKTVTITVSNVAPTRPTAGMLAFADGTNWNPGSGRGLYEYRTSSWIKL